MSYLITFIWFSKVHYKIIQRNTMCLTHRVARLSRCTGSRRVLAAQVHPCYNVERTRSEYIWPKTRWCSRGGGRGNLWRWQNRRRTYAWYIMHTAQYYSILYPLYQRLLVLFHSNFSSFTFLDGRKSRRSSTNTPTPPAMASTASMASTVISGGHKLHKIRFNFLDSVGLVGWQLLWIADGTEG